MIEGLKIELTADELVRHLDERIRHHHGRAAELETRFKQAETLVSASEEDDEDGHSMCWPGFAHDLQRRAARHKDRETLLMFFRNHVIGHEIYRLSEADLRALELLPIDERTLSI
jgi:hypothetical protein